MRRAPPVRRFAANQIHRPMVHHAHEPRLHGAALIVVRGRVAPQRHERFLHDLLRQMRLPHDAHREGSGARRVAAEQTAERLFVTTADPLHQLAVASLSEVDGLHRLAPEIGQRSNDQ
jgi:hypothetical protein